MAVTGPTPPTPPTPPVVPKVTLGGQEAALPSQGASAANSHPGGTNAEPIDRGTQGQPSGMPREEQTSSADTAEEEQARSSVAQGNGALSKTTSTTAAERAVAAKEAAERLRGESRNHSEQGDDAATTVRQEAPPSLLLPSGSDRGQALERENQATAAAAAQPSTGDSPSNHGGLLWGLGISLLLVGVFVFFQAFRRKGGRARRRREAPNMNLTGQTADEVLRALESQQAAQLKSSQAKASHEESKAAAATAAADRYRAQAEQPPKAAQPVQPVKAVRRNPEDKDAPRFEVRI